MGSLGGGEGGKRRKAMWLYPKVKGFNPSERWGHSACLCDGVLYVFGVSLCLSTLFYFHFFLPFLIP